jgi:hypothetical protein
MRHRLVGDYETCQFRISVGAYKLPASPSIPLSLDSAAIKSRTLASREQLREL